MAGKRTAQRSTSSLRIDGRRISAHRAIVFVVFFNEEAYTIPWRDHPSWWCRGFKSPTLSLPGHQGQKGNSMRPIRWPADRLTLLLFSISGRAANRSRGFAADAGTKAMSLITFPIMRKGLLKASTGLEKDNLGNNGMRSPWSRDGAVRSRPHPSHLFVNECSCCCYCGS